MKPITQSQLDTALAWSVPYPEEAMFITAVAESRLGLKLTVVEAHYIWALHSEYMCAQWMDTGDADVVLDVIRRFVEKELNP